MLERETAKAGTSRLLNILHVGGILSLDSIIKSNYTRQIYDLINNNNNNLMLQNNIYLKYKFMRTKYHVNKFQVEEVEQPPFLKIERFIGL